MSSDVQIDGVKYVPVDEVKQLQIDVIRKALESQKYLSSSAIDDIIKVFEDLGVAEDKKPNQKRFRKPAEFRYYVTESRLFRISTVQSNGAILYSTRKSPAKWNIHHAIYIQKQMNNNSADGVTRKDIKRMSDKIKKSENIIARIMYNIEFGDLNKWIEYWRVNYNQAPRKVAKPIENNPQKRKEGVIYG